VLRVPVHHLESGDVTLDAGASRYVARVRRLREGDRVLLFHPREGREAEATVLEIGRSGVRCRVQAVRDATTLPGRSVTLLQGIGKGEKLDAIVRDATELGATRVVVVETRRSVVRLGDRGKARIERLRRIADQAARQCGRGDAPEVTGPLAWPEALRLSDSRALRLCLWERASEPAGPALSRLTPGQPLVIAVGPEGGLEEAEVETARSFGFVDVSLGPFILRTETVAAAVLGATLLLTAGSRQITRGSLNE
jgi:16S rRNA (uracil1498-N3)-methyltransferase